MAVQRSGRVRAAAERSSALSLANACSMGWKSGLCAHCFDGLAHPGHLVSGEVVQDDGVAALEHWDERLGDVAAEALPVRGSVQERGGAKARAPQGGGDGCGLVVALGHRDPAALAARCPTVTAGHVGGRCGFVEEDEAIRVEVGLSLEPRLARFPHVLLLLLGGVRGPFLRVMPWRAKKRDGLLVLVWTPCSASRSRNSCRKICGSAW